ncbi:MAG: tyrosine-type recombinase/integrase [bacterium]|nr:tyrosine-type recombinase/integrase [Rhodospirillaceae bacterium]MDE0242489.1 tyrosine-type recombinase/integrase [bacterium]MDE0418492.1 tyrosine-type recombinase/integrase [bacterium]
MNRKARLTDALVRRLKPGPREYTVRDTVVPSLGIRVHPSGGRTYVHFREGSRGTLGSAELKTVEEARQESRASLAAGVPDKSTAPLFRNFATGPWRESWVHRCKPSTIGWRDRNLRNHLLPALGRMRLDRITPTAVTAWFDGYSRTAPGNANHCLQTLREIFNYAIACGHMASSPARNIKPNPRKKITRFLSREELDRLHGVLDLRSHAKGTTSTQRRQIDIIRLLLLTGCRKNEIVRLRRHEVVANQLRLRDSKTGPRTVFLNAEARTIIERRLNGNSEYLFPSPNDVSRPLNDRFQLWSSIRTEADLDDVRLHDLRHTYATYAVMQGTPLPVVAKLLGHSHSRMTLRYAHAGDRETEAAAERVGRVIAGLLGHSSVD